MRLVGVAMLCSTVGASGVAGPAAVAHADPSPIPRPDHVVIVVEENHSAAGVLGNPAAPYINSLASSGANFTQAFAEYHPSQPNYIAMFSGGSQGVTDDSCPIALTGQTLASQLISAGFSFGGYSEGLPGVGSTVCFSGAYARKHNPWADYASLPASVNMPMTSFPSDYSQLPTVSFVIPNLINDMHDGTIAQGDTWLHDNLDPYVQWAKSHNSLLILTFDEDDFSENNQIPTIITGQRVQQGAYTDHINHYSLLRTLQDAFGLPPLGASATATPIQNIWNDGTGNQNPRAAFTATVSGATVSVDGTTSSDPDGTIASYRWDWGDGASAGTGATATHAYASAGTYTVTLTVTDNNGATNAATRSVTAGAVGQALATDSFSRSVAVGWGSADTGGVWSTTSSSYYSVANGVGLARLTPGTGPTMTLGGVSTTDTVIGADVSLDKAFAGGGLYFSLLARKVGTTNYLLKTFWVSGGKLNLELDRVVGGSATALKSIQAPNLTVTANDVIRIRFSALGTNPTTLAAKAWKAGTTEPATWQLTATDGTANLQSPGAVGITTYLSSAATNSPVTASIDNFSTSTSTGNQPPTAVFAATVNGATRGGGFGGFGRSGRDDCGVLVGLG